MKALILAAGEGSRLRPLTLTCPKPVLPVGGRPLLEYIIRWLRWHSIDQVAVNLHHLPGVIVDTLGDGSRHGVKVAYSWENPILGSAGAVKNLRDFFDTTFLVVYGDMLLDTDIRPLLQLHRESGASLTMGLMHTDDPASKGIVALGGDERVQRFVEKPGPGEIEGDLASAGIYLLEPEILRWIPDATYFDLGHDLIPDLLRRDARVFGRLLSGYLLDIGTPEAYAQAQHDVWGLGSHWARAAGDPPGVGGSRRGEVE